MTRTLATGVILALMFVPLAAAQVPLDPAAEHVGEKIDEAQKDPAAYVREQASDEGVRDDLAWAVEYSCDLSDSLAQSGVPVPGSAERCDDLEEAVGVEEETEPVEEDVALAEPLEEEDEIVGEADALADDGEEAVAEILDDPLTAPEVILGLGLAAAAAIDRALDALVDRLGGLLNGLLGDLGLLPARATDLPSGAVDTVALAFQVGLDASSDFAASVADGGASAAGSVADAAAGAADAVGDAAGDAGGAVADTVSSIGSGIAGFVASLFAGEGSSDAAGAADAPADLEVGGTADNLLDSVNDRVDGLTRAAR